MALHATDSLDDALEATKTLLLPFDLGRWLRLAVIAFFVGGFGSLPRLNAGVDVPTSRTASAEFGHFLPVDTLPLVAVLAVAAALLALAFAFVGAVLEFVLVEALATREVRLRGPFREHVHDGARLLGFRVALLLVGVLLVGGAAAVGFLLQGPGVVLLPVLFALPVALVVLPVLAVVHGFTTVFVVPTMLVERAGVVDGWRRFWATLSGNWSEYLVYLLLSVVLSLVGGTAVAVVVGLVGAVVFLPAGLLGFAGLVAAGGPSPLTLVMVVPLLLVSLLILAAVTAFVSVPVVTFLRYYALFVLGATDADLDLVADLRAELVADRVEDADGGPDGTA